MNTILLYGNLGTKFGKVHHRKVKSAREAIGALCATIEGFSKELAKGSYRILAGGKECITLDTLTYPISEKNTLRIIPVIHGQGKGLGGIILGVALVGFGIWTGGAGMGLSTALASTTSTLATVGYFATSIGTSLLMGGISQALSSSPKSRSVEAASNMPSYAFDGAVNTAAQGGPVPICYGRLIVGSQVISAGLSVDQLAQTSPINPLLWKWKNR